MASLPKGFLPNYAIYFSVWTVFALFFSTQTIAQKFITGEKIPVSHHVLAWRIGCYISISEPSVMEIHAVHNADR